MSKLQQDGGTLYSASEVFDILALYKSDYYYYYYYYYYFF